MTQDFFPASPTAAPRSRSPRNNLPRGKACMSCRRRKIKCDGRRPVCSQCLRSPGTADDCEYPMEGRSRTQQLEETIKKLNTRIRELEVATNDNPSAVKLHEPYDPGDVPYMALEMPQFVDTWTSPPTLSASPTSRVNSPASASTSSTLVLEEPPPEITEQLVDSFLTNFTQVGFFLEPTNFRRCALLPFAFGHYERPSPALLSTVFLWGARLSPAPAHPVYHADAFLACALQNIHQDLGGNHPHRVLHTIQASVLLSLYYLTLGRPMEGIYHSSAAISLAISAGLHQLKSPSALAFDSPFVAGPSVLQPSASPAPPRTAREEAVCISAFWAAVIVNNYWVAAHGSPSALSYADTCIDTPWPQEQQPLDEYASPVSAFPPHHPQDAVPMNFAVPLGHYQQLQLFEFDTALGGSAGANGGTVARFLAGLDTGADAAFNSAPLALLAKASILLERAITLSARYSDRSDDAAFASLDALLAHFALSLPPPAPTGGQQHLVTVAHALAHTATIRLHARRIHASAASRTKYRAAARALVDHATTSELSSPLSARPRAFHDPILGVAWSAACDVFVAELADLQSYGAVSRLTQEYQDVSTCLETLLAHLGASSSASPLIDYLYQRAQQAYSSVAFINNN